MPLSLGHTCLIGDTPLVDDTPRIRLVESGEYARLRKVRLAALAYLPHLADSLAREGAEAAAFWVDRAVRGAAGTEMATFVALGPDRSPFVGVVDGFLAPDGNTVEIGGMWVAPHIRRTGVGRALLTAVCEWAAERGAQLADSGCEPTTFPRAFSMSALDSRFPRSPIRRAPAAASNARCSAPSADITDHSRTR